MMLKIIGRHFTGISADEAGLATEVITRLRALGKCAVSGLPAAHS